MIPHKAKITETRSTVIFLGRCLALTSRGS
jgi:hypothetical protein